MREYRVILGANEERPLDISGEFVKVVAATGDFQLRADAESGILSDFLDLEVGDKARFRQKFKKLRFKDTSGVANTLDLIIGEGDHDSASVSGSVSISNFSPATLDSSADVALGAAASHDIAADTTRRELILTAYSTNADDLRIRDQSGTTSEGRPLSPGETVVVTCQAAVRIRNNSGGALSFAIMELKG